MKLEELLPKPNLKRMLKKHKKMHSLHDLIKVQKLQLYKPGPQAHFGASGGQTGQVMTP